MERLTIQEASLRLNVSQRTIREAVRNGELQAFRQQGPRGEQWVVEVPEDGWVDRHKRSYLELAEGLPKWWWTNEARHGRVHYLQQLGIEEIEPLYLCGANSENIWSAAGHSPQERCLKCVEEATSRGFSLDTP